MTQDSPHAQFAELHISGWRQFADVHLAFHPRLTVLTGANASGKTTLLSVLGKHFNFWTQLLGVPIRDRVTGMTRWTADSRDLDIGTRVIGQLVYSHNQQRIEASLQVPAAAQAYDLSIGGQQTVPGLYISSHRSLSVYQQLDRFLCNSRQARSCLISF